MIRFIKNFYVYLLFVFAQALFMFIDCVYMNVGEPINIHINLFVITIVVAILTLSIRTIFETLILKGVSLLFKKSMSLREIVKILINSMKIPTIIMIVFSIIQMVFICEAASVYQLFVTSFVNMFYIINACNNLKKYQNKPVFYGFVLYLASYIVMQIYNISAII